MEQGPFGEDRDSVRVIGSPVRGGGGGGAGGGGRGQKPLKAELAFLSVTPRERDAQTPPHLQGRRLI